MTLQLSLEKASTKLNNIKSYYLSLFLSSLVYAFIMANGGSLVDHISANLFILTLFIHFIWANRLPKENLILVFSVLALHTGLLLGGFLSLSPENLFWGLDATSYHIPVSKKFLEHLKSFFNSKSYFGNRVLITHILTGTIFKLIGVNIFATTITTLLIKIPTVLIIKQLGDHLFKIKVGTTAALVYIFSPGIIVFSTIFFKETTIHLLIVLFFYLFYIFFDSQKLKYLLISCLILLCIGYERIYIFPPILFTMLATYCMIILKKGLKKEILLGLLSLASISLIFLFYYKSLFPLEDIFKIIQNQREQYMSLPDISKLNRSLPYPLAIIKITFAPYFTLGKFKTYFELPTLIMWSTFLNHFVMYGNAVTMFSKLKENSIRHLLPVGSFGIFILILSYFRPFDARVRDSFYPIIAIYFSYYIKKVILLLRTEESTLLRAIIYPFKK